MESSGLRENEGAVAVPNYAGYAPDLAALDAVGAGPAPDGGPVSRAVAFVTKRDPAGIGLGRVACRRKTATSCRSTRISVSVSASIRASSAHLAGGVVFLALFVVAEQRQREPMLDLSLLKIPGMAPSLLAALFQGLANFAVLFLVIMYLQGPRGLSPLHASLLLVPGYVIGSAVGPPTNLDHIFMLFEFRRGQEMQASLARREASQPV